ncbi:basic proline-rich protein-like [Epinephelus fuscoguttatus]|uniref:basic proline-rich protein-like n=1 Tax=Epinephelus fuscoguttatus TaxID=293821 RepID=UPI0020D1C81E|nr:basic proline-rich protein-like [Epinephelus fuscoguttatus]
MSSVSTQPLPGCLSPSPIAAEPPNGRRRPERGPPGPRRMADPPGARPPRDPRSPRSRRAPPGRGSRWPRPTRRPSSPLKKIKGGMSSDSARPLPARPFHRPEAGERNGGRRPERGPPDPAEGRTPRCSAPTRPTEPPLAPGTPGARLSLAPTDPPPSASEKNKSRHELRFRPAFASPSISPPRGRGAQRGPPPARTRTPGPRRRADPPVLGPHATHGAPARAGHPRGAALAGPDRPAAPPRR